VEQASSRSKIEATTCTWSHARHQALGKKAFFPRTGPARGGRSGQDACVTNGGRESHILQPACTDRRGEEIDTTCMPSHTIVFLRRPMSPQSLFLDGVVMRHGYGFNSTPCSFISNIPHFTDQTSMHSSSWPFRSQGRSSDPRLATIYYLLVYV
jgi:hypothetical protein